MPPPPMSSHRPLRRSSTKSSVPSSSYAAAARLRPRLQRPRPSSTTLSSALTKERLRDHACCASWSTTSSYACNKGLALSPGRESLDSSSRSSSSSSSILVKIHRWGTSWLCSRRLRPSAASVPAPPKTLPPYPRCESWDPGLRSPPEHWMPRRSSSPPPAVYPVEKPLRESERVPAQPAPATTMIDRPIPAAADAIGTVGSRKDRKSTVVISAPATTMIARPIPAADDAIGTVGSRKERESTVVISASSPKEDRFVWAQKYRPKALKEFICNRNRAEELLQMVSKQICSHFIVEGPPGAGKKTMVLAYLRDAFGPEKLKTNNELKKIELKGEFVSSININVRMSFQHVEVNLSDLHGYEKHVLASFINDPCTRSDKAVHCDHSNCRALVIHEADKLSTDAQHYLLWLMEKYKGCNKIFFCCSDASKLHIMRHLCKTVKLLPPSDSEIVEVLEFIATQECIDLPHALAKRIAENSKHNLRQAIRSFEASWKSNYSLKENQEILTGWEEDIAEIAKNIVEEQGPMQLYVIRGKLKNLIEHDVSPDFIFSTLITEMKKHLDDQFQAKIDAWYRDFNNRDNGLMLDAVKSQTFGHDKLESSGSKLNYPKKNVRRFMSIEEFTAKFMSFYKSAATKNNGGPNPC
ncbi:replication factor C subunit 3-like [Phoenix dactylifera]|uniref:Replication factor C subunit 3-like n=1 Tax=Phoenix dactylifera TaxID=42345 RepID=A0A8B7MUY9_PHODC|nr:replication factor C subunit 3-like [Phoenix dactylifera]